MPMSILPAPQSLEELTIVWVTVVARPPLKVRWTAYMAAAGLADGLGTGLIARTDADAVAPAFELDDDAAFEELPHAVATSTPAARATTERTPGAADRACFMGEIVHPSESHTQSRSGLKMGFGPTGRSADLRWASDLAVLRDSQGYGGHANGQDNDQKVDVESRLTTRSVARVTWWGRVDQTGEASIDDEIDAGDIRRLVRREIDEGVGDVVRAGEPAKRNGGKAQPQLFHDLLAQEVDGPLGVGRSRTDPVDPDPVLGQLGR